MGLVHAGSNVAPRFDPNSGISICAFLIQRDLYADGFQQKGE